MPALLHELLALGQLDVLDLGDRQHLLHLDPGQRLQIEATKRAYPMCLKGRFGGAGISAGTSRPFLAAPDPSGTRAMRDWFHSNSARAAAMADDTRAGLDPRP
jgi:hypothetical protein